MSTFERGKLRHRINIEQKLEQLDSSGHVVQNQGTGEIQFEWALVGKVWAAKLPLSARERLLAEQINSSVNTRFVIAYQDQFAGINVANYRINHNGVFYNLVAPFEDQDSGREWLTIMAIRGLTNG